MNGEWIYLQLVPWILSLILPYIAYRLGLRSQKIQVLREYIIGTVKDEYPLLFSEIRKNSEYLDNYLETTYIYFTFPKLNDIFDRGLDKFMERHHKDLFLTVDSFQKKIIPKIGELGVLERKTTKEIFDSWSNYLKSSLPEEAKGQSEDIASNLIKNTATYHVLPDLLNERYEEVQNKIEKCILEKTLHIYREKTKRPYVIKEQHKRINFDEISQSLIEKAKPEIVNLKEAYKELKKQNDKAKEKLLPLLQKYISNPI